MGGISIWQLLIIAVIVLLLFGSKKLRGLGGDLGAALRGFKKEMNEEQSTTKTPENVEHKKQADADFDAQQHKQTSEHDKRD